MLFIGNFEFGLLEVWGRSDGAVVAFDRVHFSADLVQRDFAVGLFLLVDDALFGGGAFGTDFVVLRRLVLFL